MTITSAKNHGIGSNVKHGHVGVASTSTPSTAGSSTVTEPSTERKTSKDVQDTE